MYWAMYMRSHMYCNNRMHECHEDARASRPMKKSHNLYALIIIIQDLFEYESCATQANVYINSLHFRC